jgi:hypothetical protein
MKNYFKSLFLSTVVLFAFSCTKNNTDPNNNNPSNPTNEYANYDFYLADRGCSVVDEFTKNFKPISGYDKAVNFNVIGNNLYSFGAKKYRNNPESDYYTKSDNYSGYLNKNGVELYTNIGGNSSSIIGVRENGADLYFVTGFESQDGIVSATSVQCYPKVYKNGTLINTLSGPFNNAILNTSGTGYVYSKSFGITISGIFLDGNDVIVYGVCDNFNTDECAYGYWKNGTFVELKRISTLFYKTKMLISESEDYYYYINNGYGQKFLFKNNIDILGNTFNNVGILDFGIFNNDIYILGSYYDNGYKLGIYKNGVLEFTTLGSDNYNAYKMVVEDGKIFITDISASKLCVYEYKISTKKLEKIGDTGKDYQGCSQIVVLGFQVTKK